MENKKKLLKILFFLIFALYPLGLTLYIPYGVNGKIPSVDIAVFLFVVSCTFLLKNNKKSILLRKEITIFLFISLFTILINLFFKVGSFTDLFYFIRITVYFLFYLKLVQLFKKHEASLINRSLLLSGLFFGFFGLIQYILYPDLRNLMYLGWDPHYYRLFSTFFDPNFAGIILVLTFFQLVFILPKKQKLPFKILTLIILSLLLLSIFLTRSRSAYLSFLVGLIVLTFRGSYLSKKAVFLILIGMFSLGFMPRPAFNVLDPFRIASSVSRFNNWFISLKTAFSRPFLGVGFSASRFSDSSLLYTFAATGILGFIAYLNIWLNILRFAINKDKQLFTISVVVLTSSFFNNTLFYPFVAIWFFGFLASKVIVYSSS